MSEIVGIPLEGEIDANLADRIIARIEAATGQRVLLCIDSRGGGHESSLRIASAIRRHGNVTALLRKAASAALTVSCACDTVYAYRDASLLAHEPRFVFDAGESATAVELEAYKQLAERGGRDVRNALMRKSKLPLRIIDKLVSLGAPLTADTARRFRLVDEVLESSAPRPMMRQTRGNPAEINMWATFKNMPPGARRAFDEANARYAAMFR